MAWVVGDPYGVRQEILQELEWKVVSISADMYSALQCNLLCTKLSQGRPALLWLRLGGPHAGSGNRRDGKRASTACRLVRLQHELGGLFMVDANLRCTTWDLSVVSECLAEHQHVVVPWCSLGYNASGTTKLVSNVPLSSFPPCQGHERHPSLREFDKVAVVSMEQGVLKHLASLIVEHRQPEFVDHRDGVQLQAWETSASSMPSASRLPTMSASSLTKIGRDEKEKIREVRFVEGRPTTPSMTMRGTATPAIRERSQGHSEEDQLSFPTEQAEKAKRKKQRMKEAGLVLDKTVLIKKVEQHYDDCGENTESILLQIDEEYFPDERSEFILDLVYSAFLLSSSSRRRRSAFDGVAIMEIFGGAGTTSQAMVEVYGLKAGPNFDMHTGFDLSTESGVKALWACVVAVDPLVLVMGPPCTGYKGWSALNAVINPETWWQTRRKVEPLARLAGELALHQLQRGRHFLTEQPAGSTMFSLAVWQRVLRHPSVAQVKFDQCQTGLRLTASPGGSIMPVKKPTVFTASSEHLLWRFRGRLCRGTHQHAVLGHWARDGPRRPQASPAAAQVWPRQLCLLLAASVYDLACEHFDGKLLRSVAHSASAFVTGKPRYDCPGCRGHFRKDHPRHLRRGDCRYADVEEWPLSCPGCLSHRPRGHSSHTLDERCQWPLIPERGGAARERSGHQPRDGRRPASSDPTGRVRLTGPAPDPGGRAGPEGAGTELSSSAAPTPSRASSLPPPPPPRPADDDEDDDWNIGALFDPPVAPHGDDSRRPPRRQWRDEGVQAGRDREIGEAPRGASTAGVGSRGSVSKPLGARGPPGGPPGGDDDDGPDGDPPGDPPGGPPGGPPGVPPDGAAGGYPRGERGDDDDDWRNFDLGRAMVELRSLRPGVVRRALRKLHLRWFHAGSATMKRLLMLAGVPSAVINQVPSIVDTCHICRSWSRPSPKTIASHRISEKFGESIQGDLLFYKRKVLLHLVDEATRYTVAGVVADRSAESLKEALSVHWLRHYGAPEKIITDGEGGLMALDAWLHAQKITLRPRAPNQHAQLVERHHEVLRQQLHRLEDQAGEEGLSVSFQEILTEAVLAKNSLLSVGGFSPYQAVHGRTLEVVDVGSERLPPNRLRELAVGAMIEATAQQRARRALGTNTRAAGELDDLHNGDLVEIYRRGVSKDEHCWQGPCEVVDTTSIGSGVISAKFQGRVLLCRVQDVRRALVYVALLSQPKFDSPLTIMALLVEQLRERPLRLGWFRHKGQWLAFEGNRHHGELLEACLHVATCYLQLEGCLQMRLGCGIRSMEGVTGSDDSVILSWPRGKIDQVDLIFMPGSNRISLERNYENAWSQRALVQFLLEDTEMLNEARRQRRDVSNFGNVFDRRWVQGGVREPRMLADASHAGASGEEEQLPQSPPARTPEHFDIGTPPGSEDEAAAERDASALPSQLVGRPTDDLVSRDSDRPPTSDTATTLNAEMYPLEQCNLEDAPSLSFESRLAYAFGLVKQEMPHDQEVVVYLNGDGSTHQVIERINNVLSRDEALRHADECKAAMRDELMRWQHHKAWKRMSRSLARNILPSRWVLKWKEVGGKRIIKARLTVQGFRDRGATQCFSGTSARWTQRLLLALAVEHDWEVHALDVSEAFLRGLTFEQVSAETGEPLRSVQLQLPDGVGEVLREVPGLQDFDFAQEVLDMLKPGYGLKDAPRLWSKRLRKCLENMMLKPLHVDPQTYVLHEGGQLRCILTVHVDDLKLAGFKDAVLRIIKGLQDDFDKIKLEKNDFEHLGLKHRTTSEGIILSQQHYVEQLRFIPESLYKHSGLEEFVNSEAKELFRSLVGGLAWAVQTRPDAAVFVGALQRHLSSPTSQHCRDANRVLHYLQQKPLEILIPKVGLPWKMVVISDAAYQGKDQDHLALRSGIIALTARSAELKGEVKLQVLDTVSKKQSRVCRSTLQAELHSSLDLFGQAAVMAHGITETLCGNLSADELAGRFDRGQLGLELELVIDAKSVLEALRPEQLRVSDKVTVIHLLKLAEHLELGHVRRLTWVDTRDMVADGLNKGIVDRNALRTLCRRGSWTVAHPTSSIQRNIASAATAQDGQPHSDTEQQSSKHQTA